MVFVNNFNEIFSARSVREGDRTLDDRVAAVFAQMKPGSRMLTLHKLVALGMTRDEVNDGRRSRRKRESDDASFFTFSEHTLQPKPREWLSGLEDVVSWSRLPIQAYLYERTRQSETHALFLCTNPKCEAGDRPTAAVGDDGLLVDCCVFCQTARRAQPRARRQTGAAAANKHS